MSNSLEIITTKGVINNIDSSIVACILNEHWDPPIHADGAIIRKRLQSQNRFFIAYDFYTDVDKEHVNQFGMTCYEDKKYPIGILETISLKTEGNIDLVPKTYNELTNNGTFNKYTENPDTLILVDITFMPTRTALGSNGEAKATVNYALKQSTFSTYEHIWTFTPQVHSIQRWHKRCGAEQTDQVFLYAREGHKNPHVRMLSYDKKIMELKIQISKGGLTLVHSA